VVVQWNQAVLAAVRAERPSVGFLTRDLAIVHTAIYDAVNTIDHTGGAFRVRAKAPAGASPVAAAAAAGLFTASALFPTDAALFQSTFRASLAGVPEGRAKDDGIAVGRFVAERTLSSRVTDGANAVVSPPDGTDPGEWRPAPPAFAPAQTPQWQFVMPFALKKGSQFRPPAPPALTGAEYAAALHETEEVGRADSAVRTPQQTEVARFWEGRGGTVNVPGYWNLIAESAAQSKGNTLDQDARLFAEVNVALADAAIAQFDAKYTYDRWRPVTAIRLADQDGNPATASDTSWLPLLNTPPNPSYVSGHATFSAAAATVLADLFGTDRVAFDLTSEDTPGVTHSFRTFAAAAAEAGNSVVWGGTHFRFDVTEGRELGNSVGAMADKKFSKTTRGDVFHDAHPIAEADGNAPHADRHAGPRQRHDHENTGGGRLMRELTNEPAADE
jgi:hypothetical protein